MSEPVWLPFGFAVTVVAPPGRRKDVMFAQDRAPFVIPEVARAPLVARATRNRGRTQEWREVDGVLHRQFLDDNDEPVTSLQAMLELVQSRRFRDYPIRSDGSAGPGSVLTSSSTDWYEREYKVVESDREKALQAAQNLVADRIKLIGGVPYIQCDVPSWGVAYPIFGGQPSRCTLVYDRDAPGAPLVTMPIDRKEDALALGHRLAARFLDRGQSYAVPATQDDMPGFEVLGRLPEYSRKDDIRRAWDLQRPRLGGLPLSLMTPSLVTAIASVDGAHDAMWVDDMPFEDAVQRMESLLRLLPVNPPGLGDYDWGRKGLGELVEVFRIVADYEVEYDVEDREALSMGLMP